MLGQNGRALADTVARYRDLGLDGIEVFYTEHSQAQTLDYLALARRYDLVMSGGSDFHGATKPGVELGRGRGNLKVDGSILEAAQDAAGRAPDRLLDRAALLGRKLFAGEPLVEEFSGSLPLRAARSISARPRPGGRRPSRCRQRASGPWCPCCAPPRRRENHHHRLFDHRAEHVPGQPMHLGEKIRQHDQDVRTLPACP